MNRAAKIQEILEHEQANQLTPDDCAPLYSKKLLSLVAIMTPWPDRSFVQQRAARMSCLLPYLHADRLPRWKKIGTG